MASKKWPEIGLIVKNKFPGKDGKEVTKLALKFADNVTILVDGQPVDMNKYRSANLTSPQEEIEGLYSRGLIEDADIETRREKATELNSWLKFKVVLPPPRDQK